jgi:hypothetical protein
LFPEILDLGETIKNSYARPDYYLILQLQTWIWLRFLDKTGLNNNTILADYNEKNIAEMSDTYIK